MRQLITIALFCLAASAQAVAPTVDYLTPDQVQRLNAKQAAIVAAQQALQLEMYAVRDELGVTSKTHGDLKQFADGRFGFERK